METNLVRLCSFKSLKITLLILILPYTYGFFLSLTHYSRISKHLFNLDNFERKEFEKRFFFISKKKEINNAIHKFNFFV
jgi:hypothetical protein